MWLFTPFGFFSVVQDWRNKDMLAVRGRVKKDLENLALMAMNVLPHPLPVLETPHSDYPYRLIMRKDLMSLLAAEIVNSITYSNFKDEVTELQGPDRHNIYLDVWSLLFNLEGKLKRLQYEREILGTTARKPRKRVRASK